MAREAIQVYPKADNSQVLKTEFWRGDSEEKTIRYFFVGLNQKHTLHKFHIEQVKSLLFIKAQS